MNPIVNETGELLTESDQILAEWATYFNTLLNKPETNTVFFRFLR